MCDFKKVGQSWWTLGGHERPYAHLISKLTCCWNPCGLLKQNNMDFGIVICTVDMLYF